MLERNCLCESDVKVRQDGGNNGRIDAFCSEIIAPRKITSAFFSEGKSVKGAENGLPMTASHGLGYPDADRGFP